MKLKNKLLPLMGTAAVAATATPLALTSCKSNNIEMVDISKGYTPTIEPHVSEMLGQHAANQAYFGDIQTNGDIFYQDYIYGQYVRIQNSINYWNNQFNGSTKINSLKVGISTPTFSSVDIYFPGEPSITYPTISVSFKLEFDIRQEYVDQIDQAYRCFDRVFSCTVDYKNMPFYAQQDSYIVDEYSTPYWYVSVPYWTDAPWVYNFNMSDWSIDYSCDAKITRKEVRFGQGATERVQEGSKSGTINTPTGMNEMFGDPGLMPHELYEVLPEVLTLGVSSYYLSNIVQVPELNSRGTMSTSILAPVGTTGTGTSVQLGTTFDGTTYSVEYNTSAVNMTYNMDEMINNTQNPGTIKLYADLDSDGKPTGDIVLNQIDVEDDDEATTLTIDAGSVLDTTIANKAQGSGDYEGFYGYGLPAGTLGKAKTSEETAEKTYKFALPKYIIAQVEIEGYEIEPQKVYLNNDNTEITVNFAE